MTTEQKPGTPAESLHSAATPKEDTTLQLLVQLMLAERQDSLLEREEKKRARQARDKQREINAEYMFAEKRQAQQLCTHKKGGRGLKGPKVDYAVSFHTFVNAESYIRCLICDMKWKNTDTQEYLIRRGVKIPNHTGLGWKDAYRMVLESSNTATSSEVKLVASPEPAAKPDFEKNPHSVEI